MKTAHNLIKSILVINIFMLTACNSGSSSTSSDVTANDIAYTLPNGTTVLPNGASVSILNPVLSVTQGKTSSTILKVEGGHTKLNLILSAIISNKQEQIANDSGLKIKFNSPNITTDTALATSNIQIDATHAVPGTYQVKINAYNVDKPNTSTTINSINVTVSNTSMLQATYLDFTDTSSLGQIPSNAYTASNLILFAFDNDINTTTINNSYLTVMQNAITSNQSAATKYFLSLGGAMVGPETYNINTVDTVVNNITAHINSYNQQFIGGQITGVDLDLEQGIDESTITALAKGFKEKGLLVSIAPQVVATSGMDIDANNPTNLGLSSGGNNNQYGTAVKNGYVDYIMLQTYNNGGVTINSIGENQVEFFSIVAQALNNRVYTSCDNVDGLCVLQGPQIAIGEVSNAGSAGGGGNIYNIFGSDGQTAYNQSSILDQLNTQIPTVLSSYSHINGVMQWSYNGDYNPTEWNDYYALSGAFTSTIFGADPVIPTPPFILQISNTATTSGNTPYGSATLVVNGQYLVYGNSSGYPLAPQYLTSDNYQQWGTSTSASNSGGTVSYSQNFDTLFSNGANSFTASKIIINVYTNGTTSVNTPTAQYACLNSDGSIMTYTFEPNLKYNVQINPVYQSCAVSIMGSL